MLGARRRGSRAWALAFRTMYAGLRLLDPLIRAYWRRFGLGNVVELTMRGRRTGESRSVLLGLLAADDALYLGHPNGEAGWTRNLGAAAGATLASSVSPPLECQLRRLSDGPERDAAIRATFTQHPFPGNLIYRAAAAHVRAAGVYYRVDVPRYATGARARGDT